MVTEMNALLIHTFVEKRTIGSGLIIRRYCGWFRSCWFRSICFGCLFTLTLVMPLTIMWLPIEFTIMLPVHLQKSHLKENYNELSEEVIVKGLLMSCLAK